MLCWETELGLPALKAQSQFWLAQLSRRKKDFHTRKTLCRVAAQLAASPEVPPMPMRETQASENIISLLHASLLPA